MLVKTPCMAVSQLPPAGAQSSRPMWGVNHVSGVEPPFFMLVLKFHGMDRKSLVIKHGWKILHLRLISIR